MTSAVLLNPPNYKIKGCMKGFYRNDFKISFLIIVDGVESAAGVYFDKSKNRNFFTLVVNSKPTYQYRKIFKFVFGIIFSQISELDAVIKFSNKKSIKMAKQFGFRKIYNEGSDAVFSLLKSTCRYI